MLIWVGVFWRQVFEKKYFLLNFNQFHKITNNISRELNKSIQKRYSKPAPATINDCEIEWLSSIAIIYISLSPSLLVAKNKIIKKYPYSQGLATQENNTERFHLTS
jgi:hypothetical protein